MEETINNYTEVGKNKVTNKTYKTFLLAILAGAFIAFAAVAANVAASNFTNFSLAKILSALIFPFGLILVVLFKTELFTGNCLLVIPKMKKEISFKQLFKNLIIVYIGNFIGAIIIALMLKLAGHYDLSNIGETALKVAKAKISYDFIQALFLGILCNILVCMAVLLSFSVKSTIEKMCVIYLPIFFFIIMGLEHSVANMYYLTAGYLVDSSIGLKSILLNNLLPVTLGNIIGGMGFAFIIYYVNKK